MSLIWIQADAQLRDVTVHEENRLYSHLDTSIDHMKNATSM